MERYLQIEDLRASVDGKPILNGIDLRINSGEIHALMGPNGSGKSTLAHALLGHPGYEVTGGRVLLDGEDVLEMETHERARRGLFLAFQYPVEIPGVAVGKFLRRAIEARNGEGTKTRVTDFMKRLRETMDLLGLDDEFVHRDLNEGFSGGEKKRMEIVQMLMLRPAFSILDETDSGLDIDALKLVAKGVNRLRGDGFGGLVITHYQRILDHIQPDYVHVMFEGRIVISGDGRLVEELESRGYDWIREAHGNKEAIDARYASSA